MQKNSGGAMRRLAGIGTAVLLAAAVAETKGALSADDYAEITQLFARYVHAHDSRDSDAFAAVFTDDAVFVNDNGAPLPGAPSGVMTWTGKKELAGMMGYVRRERPKMTLFFTNLKIDPSPEGAKVAHYVMVNDFQKTPAVTAGGFCENNLVKTKQGWRLKKRVCYVEPGPAKPSGQNSAR
jgi:hypothetical protein